MRNLQWNVLLCSFPSPSLRFKLLLQIGYIIHAPVVQRNSLSVHSGRNASGVAGLKESLECPTENPATPLAAVTNLL